MHYDYKGFVVFLISFSHNVLQCSWLLKKTMCACVSHEVLWPLV